MKTSIEAYDIDRGCTVNLEVGTRFTRVAHGRQPHGRQYVRSVESGRVYAVRTDLLGLLHEVE